jgi:hypothetical protein
VHLHEIARHLFHSNETLDVAVDTIRRLLASYSRLLPLEKRDGPVLLNFHDRISALEKDVQGIKRRSESLKERLQNEISLVILAYSYLNLIVADASLGIQSRSSARQPDFGSDGRGSP